MATRYLEEYASEADFLAASVDAPGKVGFAAVSEAIVINKSGSVVEVVDETRAQTLTNKTLTAPVITGSLVTETTLTPTIAFALTAAQSGTSVLLNASDGFAITLPAAAAGLRFKFTVAAAFANTNFTVVTPAGANLIFGGATVAGADVPASAEDSINFVATAELPGDFVEVWSDGTNWFVNGRGTTAGSITFTAA